MLKKRLITFGAGVALAVMELVETTEVWAIGGETTGKPVGGLDNPLGSGADDAQGIIQGLTARLQHLAIPVVAVMVLVGAFQMLFSAGNEQRFATGRKTIIYSVIGYGILLLVGGIADLIRNLLGA